MMAHHLARLAEIGRRADIEPCAGNWEIAHFRTRPDSSGNEIGSIEPMLRHIIDQTVADQINAGIGIVGICGFFLYAGHPVAIDGKDGKRNAYGVGHCGYRYIRTGFDMAQIEFFK